MNVGILIITHSGIGASIFGTARFMIDDCPLNVKLLSANRESDPDELLESASILIKELDKGDGVLILTDLYGSTPSNIAHQLDQYADVKVVTGLNLSMLIRVFNYAELGLTELTEKAYSGGRDGITIDNDNGPDES
ncbi:MAG: PTS fructose transporter subunit IIA [Proteobacteria bacterium]|nr:PTS fructose transporter subunit IIA [Pseudomonadota bacterium]